MAFHNELGRAGEQAACELLISKGLTIRETNWRLNHLEIDIVAHDPAKNLLHIVEVKTRTSDAHYDPMSSITLTKQRNLINAANGYLRYNQLKCGIQYDVIIIIGNPGNFKINYIPHAFYPRIKTYLLHPPTIKHHKKT